MQAALKKKRKKVQHVLLFSSHSTLKNLTLPLHLDFVVFPIYLLFMHKKRNVSNHRCSGSNGCHVERGTTLAGSWYVLVH